MMQTSQDSDIPHPILLSIFNVLDPVSLSRIAAVNHTWNRLSSASLQWHRHLLALKNHGLFPDDVQLTKWRLGTESTYAIDTSSRTAPVETLNVTTMKAQYVAWWEDHIRHGVLARLMEQHECNVEGMKQLVSNKVIADWGKQECLIPLAGYTLLSMPRVMEVMFDVYPTNNALLHVTKWDLYCGDSVPEEVRPYGDTVMKIMNENQGCCYWFVVVDSRKRSIDPPVFVGDLDYEGGEPVPVGLTLANERLSDFFMEYAKEGFGWHRQEQFKYLSRTFFDVKKE